MYSKVLESCPARKSGPCRPKIWSNEDLGFMDVMVMQCTFCGHQVLYSRSTTEEVAENVSSNVGAGDSSSGVFLH